MYSGYIPLETGLGGEAETVSYNASLGIRLWVRMGQGAGWRSASHVALTFAHYETTDAKLMCPTYRAILTGSFVDDPTSCLSPATPSFFLRQAHPRREPAA